MWLLISGTGIKTMATWDALILAGGRSRRMGTDKGLLAFGQGTWVDAVAQRLKGAQSTWLSIHDQQAHYEALGYQLVNDADLDNIAEDSGPLAGILAAMTCSQAEYLLVSPCDTPKLTTEYAQRMTAGLQDPSSSFQPVVQVAFDGQREQNLHLCVPTQLKDDLEAYLLEGGRSVYGWLKRHAVHRVDFSDVADTFCNLNTPEDRERYL